MKYFITGSAGFIGFHLCRRLLKSGHQIIGIDNMNAYYDVQLKESRNAVLQESPNYLFKQVDVSDASALNEIFENAKPDIVVHLAAQAGVRYSIENPQTYLQSNLVGFFNILECCRRFPVLQLLYASSSSVYGDNAKIPFSEDDKADEPLSFYGATKKANEAMAHSYSHLYKIPCIGLRFFSVYGPWGRPDMAYFSFTRDIISGHAIKVYNFGKMKRDFTYIDDIIEGIVQVMDLANGASKPETLAKIYNIGRGHPVGLDEFINEIERALGLKAEIEFLPMQAGDAATTYADVSALIHDTGYRPNTPLGAGIDNFIRWYCTYYK